MRSDDHRHLPLMLNKVLLQITTQRNESELRLSQVGASLRRLSFDKRLTIHTTLKCPKDQSERTSRLQFQRALPQMLKHESSGFVWIHEDLLIYDFFLIERLSEWWPGTAQLAISDAQGRLLFWAISAAAVRKASGQPSHSDGQRGAAPAADAWSKLDGAFPAAEMAFVQQSGMGARHFPLSVGIEVPTTAAHTQSCLVQTGAVVEASAAVRPKNIPLLVVCATRAKQADFLHGTATGRSVARLKSAGLNVRMAVTCENTRSLSEVFNKAITPANADCVAIFTHDDVWMDDTLLDWRLNEALARFDLVGVAGNRNRYPSQPAWAFPSAPKEWDRAENLLGAVAHGGDPAKDKKSNGQVSVYGAARRGSARLLDGVFLATRVRCLLETRLRFDERFDFHFYDLDFCREAERRGLSLGVWPIAITHQSGGHFGGLDWLAGLGRYTGKWQD